MDDHNFKYGDVVTILLPGFYEGKTGIVLEENNKQYHPHPDKGRSMYSYKVRLPENNELWFFEIDIKKYGMGELVNE